MRTGRQPTVRRCAPHAAVLLAGLFLALLCEPAVAQQAVQLSGVPEKLSFPIPAGSNVVLTASVEGSEPRAVWLARDKDARLRIMLSRVGAGRYQANLADPEVAGALCAGGDSFQVFAELPDGAVISSIAVHYAAAPRLHLPPRVYVLMDGQRREVLDGPEDPFLEPALRARLTGQSIVLTAEGGSALRARAGKAGAHWCEPGNVQRVELEFPAESVRPGAEARAGEKAWPLDPLGHAGGWTLSITPEIRRAWEQDGTLNLRCTEAGEEVLHLAFRVPPPRLDLKGDKAELTITQRTSKAVPGSGGYLAIYIDDITGGQVRLSLATASGNLLVDQKCVREGDTLNFDTHNALYELAVKKLVNYIIGDDYAVLTVERASAETEEAEQGKIQGLLDALAKEDVVFLGDKEEHTAAQVAAALRAELEKGTASAPTLEQFIARVASRSAETGKEYQVRRAGGERLGARTWMDGLASAPAPSRDGQAAPARPRAWAEAVEKPGLPNLHRVTKTLYRGAQPTAAGIRELEAMGVKTIVNLRSMHSDRDMLEGTGLGYVEIPCHAWHAEEEDVVAFLKAISDDAKGPFFVHCQHGADRTGMMIAIYRVVCEGWSKDEAIDEMTKGDFGFHPLWTGLPAYVRSLDVEAIRKKAGLSAR